MVWMEKIKLSDICSPKQWKTIPTSDLLDEGYPVYGANGIIGYYNEYNHEHPVVAVTCRGATCGSINITIPKAYVTGNAMCLDDVRNDIDMNYLYYCLKHYDFNSIISGSAQPQITRQGMNKIYISICSNAEQIEIVDRFRKIEKVISLRKQELQSLENLIKARFVEMFGDAVANPMNWPVKKLKDLSVQINSGNTPKGGSENYVEEGITFFRSQNVWKDRLEMDDIAYIDADTHASMKRSSLKHGDILMTKTGRINTENSSLGRAALYMGEDDMANVNGHVYFIRLKAEVNNKFVLRILVSPEYRDLIRSVCVGGIDKRQLNKEHIEEFPIICPPKDLVDSFIDFVEKVDKSKVAVQKSLEKTQLLFDSLMQEYFG